MRTCVLAAALGALLAVPLRAPAQADAGGDAAGGAGGVVPEPPAPPHAPAPAPGGVPAGPVAPPPPGAPARASALAPIRPILLAGLGGGGGAFTVSADLGVRVAPVMVWFGYRGMGLDGGLISYASGRVGWILAERSWIAVYAAGGGGKLRYVYNVGPGSGTAGVVAFSAELGVQLFQREFGGPGLAVAIEGLAPLPRTPDPRNGQLSAPAVLVTVSLNPLYLLLHPMVW